MTKLVIGCGYLGHRVAGRWLNQGGEVAVVTRSRQRAEALRREGFRPVVADVTDPESLRHLPEAQTVLHSLAYDPHASRPRRAVVVDGLRNVLDALSPRTGRLLFISSTGVMGGHDGEWVDEATSCRPHREAGCCGLEAEMFLGSHALGRRTVILRLAGLYGPGRLPKLADVLAGRPLAASAQAYLNLIHVDDAVQVILAAETSGILSELYLVSDGCPTSRGQFYGELARQLGAAEPTFCQPEPGSRGAAAASGNKRVRNQKMLQQLRVELAFPDFRKGLADVCRGYRQPGV